MEVSAIADLSAEKAVSLFLRAGYYRADIVIAGKVSAAKEATGAPLAVPAADVFTIAKKDLQPGERLDGIGGVTVRGEILGAREAKEKQYLPLELAQDVRVCRFIPQGTVLTYADLETRGTDAMWRLRAEQDKLL